MTYVPFSYRESTGDGSNVNFSVPFPYLKRAHVFVTVDGAAQTDGTDYSWTADNNVQFVSAPASGAEVLVQRQTPKNDQIVQWANGSYIISEDLNEADLQFLYLIQEALDAVQKLEVGTGGSTGVITEAQATKDPTDPAWSGDALLGTVGAIDRVYANIVGSGSSYPGPGNEGKHGKIRILTSGGTPDLFYWSTATDTWVQISTKGDAGPQGQKGDAATIKVNSTTTLAAGANATVLNSGTTSAAELDFGIPKGVKGDKGDKGISGAATQSDWNEADNSKAEFINNKPTIPAAQVNSDWAQTDATKLDFIENKPSIPPLQEQSDWNQSDSAAVDFIKNKPSISGAQVNSDWAETDATKKSFIQNKPTVTVNGDDDITNVRVDLNYTKAADQGTVTNTKGDDAVIPVADGTNAGLLSAADKTKLDGLSGALVYKGQVDLTGTTVPSLAAGDAGFTYMNSTNGSCSSEWAGKTSGLTAGDAVTQNDMVTWDGTQFIFQKNTGGNGKTDLGWTSASTQGTVTSSTGANATVPKVDTNNAGLMLPGDFDKLGGIQADAQKNVKSDWNASTGDAEIQNKPVIAQSDWAQTTSSDPAFIKNKPTITMDGGNVDNISVNLTYTASATNGIVNSDKGTNATLPLVVANGNAGLMTGTDKNKLDGIAGGAQVNVGTDLSNTTNATQVTVQSSTGDNTTLDQANGTNAGVMSAAMYTKLNGLGPGGDDNVQSDWDVTDAASDAFIQNKPTIPVVPTVGNGKLTVKTAGEGASSTGTYSANQVADSSITLPTIRYQDLSGKPTIPAPVTPGNGQINVNAGDGLAATGTNATANQGTDTTRALSVKAKNNTISVASDGISVNTANLGIPAAANNGQINVNAGNGLSASGSNATANQGTDTTRTLTVVAKDNTISVASDGVSVNTANLGIPAAANNGEINVDVGDGLSASGSNATANQSGNTTRTLSLDQTFVQKMIDDSGGGGGGDTSGASAWGTFDGTDGSLEGDLNVASVTRTNNGRYTVVFGTAMPSANYSVVASSSGTTGNNLGNVDVVSQSSTGFDLKVADQSNTTNDAARVNFAVFSINALPPKGGTGTDAWVTFIGTQRKSNTSQNPVIGEEVPIEASFNVKSVVYNDTGSYTINFNTPMPTAKYAVSGSATLKITGQALPRILAPKSADTCTTSSVQVYTADDGGNYDNCGKVSVVINATNATLPATIDEETVRAAAQNPGCSAWGYVTKDSALVSGLNIASVTRTGAGKFDVVFVTPMPSSDYSVTTCIEYPGASDGCANVFGGSKTANGFTISLTADGSIPYDYDFNFTVFATNALPPKGGTGTDAWARVLADTGSGGTPTPPPAGFNVDTISRTNNGTYQVVFTTPMLTADYSVSASGPLDVYTQNYTTAGFEVITASAGTKTNSDFAFSVNATNATLPTTFSEAQIQGVIDAKPECIAKCWIRFDGENNKVLSSSGVTAVTQNSNVIRVTFDKPFPTKNYCVTCGGLPLNLGNDVYNTQEYMDDAPRTASECLFYASQAQFSYSNTIFQLVFYHE